MKLAITFELPLGEDQLDREGELSEFAFAKAEPAFDMAERLLARVVVGDETASRGYSWKIIGNRDGLTYLPGQ